MLRQLDVANHYQVLLRFYYDKLNIKQHRKQICRKRHDLVHNQGEFYFSETEIFKALHKGFEFFTFSISVNSTLSTYLFE